jgi:hypothetical protein
MSISRPAFLFTPSTRLIDDLRVFGLAWAAGFLFFLLLLS